MLGYVNSGREWRRHLPVLKRFGEGMNRSYIKNIDGFMFEGVCLSKPHACERLIGEESQCQKALLAPKVC